MHLVEYGAEDGTTLLVQVSPVTSPGEVVTRGLGERSVVDRAERTFQAALQPIRAVADGVLAQLNALARNPDEVKVDFGLQLTGTTGAVLTSAGATAHLRVELTWKAQPNRHQ